MIGSRSSQFADRIQLHAFASNLVNFLQTLGMPKPIRTLVDDDEASPSRWRKVAIRRQCSARFWLLMAQLRPPPAANSRCVDTECSLRRKSRSFYYFVAQLIRTDMDLARSARSAGWRCCIELAVEYCTPLASKKLSSTDVLIAKFTF